MIAGLLLAAGAGTRFGGDKLLAPLNGQPLVLHTLAYLAPATDVVLAVVRPGDAALHATLARAGVQLLECPDAHLGMGHSLAWGACHAPAGAHLLVALADVPQVKPQTATAVAAALTGGAPIALPVHAGRRGHPVGFAANLRGELSRLRGDAGARTVLVRHRDAVVEIGVDDPGILRDVDTPAALDALASRRCDPGGRGRMAR